MLMGNGCVSLRVTVLSGARISHSAVAPLQYATSSSIPINSQFMIITRHAGNNALLKNNQASGWGTANE
jgi:hypothetical protein